MGRLFVINLEGRSIFKCKHCHTDFALFEHIMSKSFTCRHGKAFLFDKLYAHHKAQKYKEGKFILERFKILGPDEGNDNDIHMINQEAHAVGSDADDA